MKEQTEQRGWHPVHIGACGEKIFLRNMKLDHLINTIRWIDKQAIFGVNITLGLFSTCDGKWRDSRRPVYGFGAKMLLNRDLYVEELVRRGYDITLLNIPLE